MPAKLSIHTPDQAVAIHLLADGSTALVLGRDPQSALAVRHASVSRQHAQLARGADGNWLLTDLGSKNGTRIDGVRIGSAELGNARWFAVGDVYCEFEVIDAAAAQHMTERAAERRDASAAWTRRMQADTDLQQLLTHLLDGMVQVSECQRGFLLTVANTRELRVVSCFDLQPDELQAKAFSGSRSAVERAIQQRRAVYLSDHHDRLWLKDQASVIAQGIQALACLPLLHQGELLGLAYLDTAAEARVFTSLDAELLDAMVDHAASVMAASRMAAQLEKLSACVAISPQGQTLLGEAPSWPRLGGNADSPR